MNVNEVKEFYHSKGYKMIPLGKRKKSPRYGFRFEQLQQDNWDFDISEDENIGMGHGAASGTYAIDLDIQGHVSVLEALAIVSDDPQKMLDKTLVVKTPKQGVHLIFRAPDGVYPTATSYTSPKYPNVKIDIKSTNGMTVFPPSTHPEDGLGQYEFASSTMEPCKLRWEDALNVLKGRGFGVVSKVRRTPDEKGYDYGDLIKGGFNQGERRIKQKSLYIKKRVMGSTEQDAIRMLEEINKTCEPPFGEVEFGRNMRDAERYFKMVVQPDMQQEGKAATKSEKRNTYLMAEHIMEKMHILTDISGEMYWWDSGRYRKGAEPVLRQVARSDWEDIRISTGEINEIINILRDRTLMVAPEEHEDIFDADHRKVVMLNGIFDFDSMEFTDHNPELVNLIRHPIKYDPAATCPRFLRFLTSCFGTDLTRMHQCMELMALCFIKRYIVQKGYIMFGIGSNGKSTFLNILTAMLGKANTASVPIQDFQNSQFLGAFLRGKSANISADGGTEPIHKTGFLKEVLGGDAIKCEEKYKNPFMYSPYATMIFTFNELPMVRDSSDGFARKIQTIHWDQKFEGADKDVSVDRIKDDPWELAGIFNRLVPVIRHILESGRLRKEDTVKETKSIILSRSDSWIGFERAQIVHGADLTIEHGELYMTYAQWCDEQGLTAIPTARITARLREAGYIVQRTRRGPEQVRMWHGLTTSEKLRPENQDAMDEHV